MIEDENDSEGGWVDTHHYDSAGAPAIEEKVTNSNICYTCDHLVHGRSQVLVSRFKKIKKQKCTRNYINIHVKKNYQPNRGGGV